MRKLSFAFLIFFSMSALAKRDSCQDELAVNISKLAHKDQTNLKLSIQNLNEIVSSGLSTFVRNEKCVDDQAVVFPHHLSAEAKRDIAFKLEVSRDDRGRVWIDRIREIPTWEQREYFDRIAKCEGLTSVIMPLPRPLLDRNEIEFPGYVQVKLRDKHGLSVLDVMGALARREGEPKLLYTDRGKIKRHELFASTERGRDIKVVIGTDATGKTVSLISAY
jgi:hypothetical protein